MTLEELKYPIGQFKKPDTFTASTLQAYIQTISSFPEKLREEVEELDPSQLDTAYRENGWTIRQVVHHCADSHMNALMRFKLTLTEDTPTIRPYKEALWANLADSAMPIESSLLMLEGIHAHMAVLWKSLKTADLEKKYVHPEYKTIFTLAEAMALYDWHARHHLAHITTLKKRKNW